MDILWHFLDFIAKTVNIHHNIAIILFFLSRPVFSVLDWYMHWHTNILQCVYRLVLSKLLIDIKLTKFFIRLLNNSSKIVCALNFTYIFYFSRTRNTFEWLINVSLDIIIWCKNWPLLNTSTPKQSWNQYHFKNYLFARVYPYISIFFEVIMLLKEPLKRFYRKPDHNFDLLQVWRSNQLCYNYVVNTDNHTLWNCYGIFDSNFTLLT